MPKFNWRSLDDTYYDHIEQAEMTGIAWECLRRNASFERDYQTISSSDRTIERTDSVSIGGWFFAADPDRSFLEQTIFWAPEAVPTIVPVRPASLVELALHTSGWISNELNESQFRQGPDGWHAVLSFARRRASYLVQGSADRRRCLHRRIAVRPRLRIQGGCRYTLVARAQRPTAGRASARDFGISPAANCTRLAGVGCTAPTALPIAKSPKFCCPPNAFPSGTGERTRCGIRSNAWSRLDSLWCRAATALC